ncbi:MAG: response regulator transcription factor [Flavobacteriales bacterium]|nr:response regulator transcription factor [Flavobacteriales bacterium]
MSPSRLIIADPLELIAEGVRSWLRDEDDLELAYHVRTGTELIELLRRRPVDLVLLEVSLPGMDGIDSMRAIHKEFPSQRVLAFSALTEIEYVNSMLVEGACGYLVKGGPREELLLALRASLIGEHYLSDAASRSIQNGYTYTEKSPDGEYIGLTQREREIIRLIALERTNAEIGAALFISEDTVKSHRKRLLTKLNVRTSAGLVKYAIDRRWA